MARPTDLKYVKTHEWVNEIEQGRYRVGITDFAQDQLGDIVFIDFPEVGDQVTKGEQVAEIESVKTVSDIYSPFTGVIAKINQALDASPEAVNSQPFDSWLFEIEKVSESETLLSVDEYNQFVQEEE